MRGASRKRMRCSPVPRGLRASCALLCTILMSAAAGSADAPADLQRLQIERDRQQMELRLRMQQQQERALRPPGDPLTEQRRGMLEREQVQRQQQRFDEQARGLPMVAPEDAASAARRELERQRLERDALEQAQRFERERRAREGETF